MSDRPILFSAPMVRALLDGRKTQTRRILKPQPHADASGVHFEGGEWFSVTRFGDYHLPIRFAKGDRLWVRESCLKPYAHSNADSKAELAGYIYRADGPEYLQPIPLHQWGAEMKWRVSIHMPREASRLTLTVTDVRVQRANEIEAADRYEEGINRPARLNLGSEVTIRDNARNAFSQIWEAVNGVPIWNDTRWVAAITFTVERRNIDAAQAKAA